MSAFTNLFRKPKSPTKVMPESEPVTDDSEEVKEAAAREADALRKRRGRASTILTGPGGVMTSPNVYKTILG